MSATLRAMNECGVECLFRSRLQRVQVCQQIVDLLLGQHLRETFHLVSAEADDATNPLIIGRHSAGREVRPFEDPLQARPLPLAR